MREQADRLREIVADFQNEFGRVDEVPAGAKLSPDKWSPKEIIGHLIDSASNNHQRFIRLLLSDSLDFPDYKNSEWLEAGRYNVMSWADLFSLFVSYNRLLEHVISGVEPSRLAHKWNIQWNDAPSITLGELIDHYFEHLQGHLQHLKERLTEIDVSRGLAPH